MSRGVIDRAEMEHAALRLGGTPVTLGDYRTTGLVAVAVGPRGCGKTNAGLLMAEQLSGQGWVSVLIDPEGELESMYGEAVPTPGALGDAMASRDRPIVVVNARDAKDFAPFGRALLASADVHRKPAFVVVDEGQLFSSSRRRGGGMGEASDVVADIAERGRKRAIDLFVTAQRFTGSLQRTLFANKNLTLVGWQEDPMAWSGLAPQFGASKIGFAELNALSPGEFMCISRQGIEKVRMPMAEALRAVAPKAGRVGRTLPASFNEWSRAMSAMPAGRLEALDADVVALLGAVAGLTPQQMAAGRGALKDEMDDRA